VKIWIVVFLSLMTLIFVFPVSAEVVDWPDGRTMYSSRSEVPPPGPNGEIYAPTQFFSLVGFQPPTTCLFDFLTAQGEYSTQLTNIGPADASLELWMTQTISIHINCDGVEMTVYPHQWVRIEVHFHGTVPPSSISAQPVSQPYSELGGCNFGFTDVVWGTENSDGVTIYSGLNSPSDAPIITVTDVTIADSLLYSSQPNPELGVWGIENSINIRVHWLRASDELQITVLDPRGYDSGYTKRMICIRSAEGYVYRLPDEIILASEA
jgi:hypothetical protein